MSKLMRERVICHCLPENAFSLHSYFVYFYAF